MQDRRDENIVTDRNGQQTYRDSGLPVPKPVDDSDFRIYDHGCPLCGNYDCNGMCFK